MTTLTAEEIDSLPLLVVIALSQMDSLFTGGNQFSTQNTREIMEAMPSRWKNQRLVK
jgi:hypothetical protein